MFRKLSAAVKPPAYLTNPLGNNSLPSSTNNNPAATPTPQRSQSTTGAPPTSSGNNKNNNDNGNAGGDGGDDHHLNSNSNLLLTPQSLDLCHKLVAKLPQVLTPHDKLNFFATVAPFIAISTVNSKSYQANEDAQWFDFDFAQFLLGVALQVFPPMQENVQRIYPSEFQFVFWTENPLNTRLQLLLTSMDLPFRSFPDYQVYCGEDRTKPILSGKREKLAVVAIDFGSTHSGFAFSLLRPPQTIVMTGEKQPTAALFERGEQLKLLSFGQDAREIFMRNLAGDLLLNKFSQKGEFAFSTEKYLYFDGDIKMRLWENNSNKREEELDARTCRTLGGNEHANLLEVVSKILQKIKENALDAVTAALTTHSSTIGLLSPAPGGLQSPPSPMSTGSLNSSPHFNQNRKKDSTLSTSSNNSSVTAGNPSQSTRKVQAEDVLWVITVPAIWRESDKQFMRKACSKAGIITDSFSSDLVLALEPECAALASKLQLQQQQQQHQQQQKFDLDPGSKLLVLDIGGGTCDVCAIEVLNPPESSSDSKSNAPKKFQCKLLLVPSGGDWGGLKIDERFNKFIEDLFGSAILERCAHVNPACLIELQDQWEKLKLGLKLDDYLDESGEIKKQIDVSYVLNESQSPLNLSALCKRFNQKLVTTNGKSSSSDNKSMHISCKSETMLGDATILRIPVKLLRTFFDPVFDPIVNHISYLMRTFPTEFKMLNQILLVGGVGSNPYLRYKFERTFPSMRVVNVKSSTNLVAMGAVKFGLQPSVIATRRARMTLGIKTTVEYNSQLHRGRLYRENKFFDRNTKKHYIRNVFKPFLVAGEEVESEKMVVHKFQPPGPDADRVKFDVFTCDERHPVEFVIEEGCRLLARIYVPVKKGEMPMLEMRLKIGFTEISAEVVKQETGEVVLRRVLFEFHPDESDEKARMEELEEEERYEKVLDNEVDDLHL